MQSQNSPSDELLAVLAARDRRLVLELLRRNGGASVDSLSAQLTGARESEALATTVGDTRTRIELHHAHLPRLDAAGLLEYDSDTGLVEPAAPSDDRLDTLLETGDEAR
ncbi:DUF7344 domain-containing protein [Halopiger thermotolerans]